MLKTCLYCGTIFNYQIELNLPAYVLIDLMKQKL